VTVRNQSTNEQAIQYTGVGVALGAGVGLLIGVLIGGWASATRLSLPRLGPMHGAEVTFASSSGGREAR
jgi:hypothetical protein